MIEGGRNDQGAKGRPSRNVGRRASASVRALHRLTLRKVEEVTGISNAYLSQLETGKIAQPSPNYLYKLAEVYLLPYDLLMEKAGYIARSPQGDTQPRRTLAGAALPFLDDVTEDEAAELAAYLAYLRWKSGKAP